MKGNLLKAIMPDLIVQLLQAYISGVATRTGSRFPIIAQPQIDDAIKLAIRIATQLEASGYPLVAEMPPPFGPFEPLRERPDEEEDAEEAPATTPEYVPQGESPEGEPPVADPGPEPTNIPPSRPPEPEPEDPSEDDEDKPEEAPEPVYTVRRAVRR